MLEVKTTGQRHHLLENQASFLADFSQ